MKNVLRVIGYAVGEILKVIFGFAICVGTIGGTAFLISLVMQRYFHLYDILSACIYPIVCAILLFSFGIEFVDNIKKTLEYARNYHIDEKEAWQLRKKAPKYHN